MLVRANVRCHIERTTLSKGSACMNQPSVAPDFITTLFETKYEIKTLCHPALHDNAWIALTGIDRHSATLLMTLAFTGDAVLFSAHFDSAATAPGATDDGMSVAALLQMLTYLSENQPRRTAVFNINNGEENGLSGAHVYVASFSVVVFCLT